MSDQSTEMREPSRRPPPRFSDYADAVISDDDLHWVVLPVSGAFIVMSVAQAIADGETNLIFVLPLLFFALSWEAMRRKAFWFREVYYKGADQVRLSKAFLGRTFVWEEFLTTAWRCCREPLCLPLLFFSGWLLIERVTPRTPVTDRHRDYLYWCLPVWLLLLLMFLVGFDYVRTRERKRLSEARYWRRIQALSDDDYLRHKELERF